ncbi:hypothetical protein L9F63_009824 [Diploptera punctata]|uniref:Gustatory receptor n=1 Tax=Diploptera punctata TaxID=6984 RepID=A0AAD8ES93_DIPPU|nr:hypothetical protein L9F63_009824 [Diploptera punctata]
MYINKRRFIYRDIYRSMWPLYLISKCLGLAPYCYISEDKNKTFRTSYPSILYTWLMVLLIGVCFIISISARMTWVYPTVKITTTVADVLILCSIVFSAITTLVLSLIKTRKAIDTILKQITDIDSQILTTPKTVYLKTKLLLSLQIICIFCALAFLYCYDCLVWVKTFGYRNMYYIVSYLVFTINYIMNLQFVYFVLLLMHRFKRLNSLVTENGMYSNISCKQQLIDSIIPSRTANRTNRTSEANDSNVSFSDPCRVINAEKSASLVPSVTLLKPQQKFFKLRVLHDTLCDVLVLVNDIYGFPILVDIATTFINITTYLYFCLYYTLHLHSYDSEQINIGHMLSLHLFWLLLYALKIVCISVSCHCASLEASRTGVLIQKLLLMHDWDIKCVNELKAFDRQLQPRQLRFTAYDFFQLDLSLLCSIAGAVTTYLVILLQFEISN